MSNSKCIERLNVSVEREVSGDWGGVGLSVVRAKGGAAAGVVAGAPQQLLAGGLRGAVVPLLPRLVELLPLSEHLPERVFTDDGPGVWID